MAPANRRQRRIDKTTCFHDTVSPTLTNIDRFCTDQVLLLHGSNDKIVPFQSTMKMKNSKLLSNVNEVTCKIVRDANHVDPIMNLMERKGKFWKILVDWLGLGIDRHGFVKKKVVVCGGGGWSRRLVVLLLAMAVWTGYYYCWKKKKRNLLLLRFIGI